MPTNIVSKTCNANEIFENDTTKVISSCESRERKESSRTNNKPDCRTEYEFDPLSSDIAHYVDVNLTS